jgi:predicted nucleic acid-binding protein
VAKSDGILDAGPLIHLSELGALDALQGFDNLLVPPTVVEEVKKYRHDALLLSGLTFISKIQLDLAPDLLAMGRAFLLDQGELEALALLQVHPNAIFFTDDSAARLAAEQIGYRTHGTLGLLIRSVRKKYREPIEVIRLLENLPYTSSLHISKTLLDDVVQRLKKEWFS